MIRPLACMITIERADVRADGTRSVRQVHLAIGALVSGVEPEIRDASGLPWSGALTESERACAMAALADAEMRLRNGRELRSF